MKVIACCLFILAVGCANPDDETTPIPGPSPDASVAVDANRIDSNSGGNPDASTGDAGPGGLSDGGLPTGDPCESDDDCGTDQCCASNPLDETGAKSCMDKDGIGGFLCEGGFPI